MKHLLLLTSALAFAITAEAAAPVSFSPRKIHATRAEKIKADRRAAQHSPEATMWRAGTENTSDWTGEEWEPTSVITRTYDNDGRTLTELTAPAEGNMWDGYSRETNTYNADGMLISRLSEYSEDGSTWENSESLERAYDPIVKNLIVFNKPGYWTGSDWSYNSNYYRRVVTRDNAGNITEIAVEVMYEDQFDATQRFTVKYGTDGRATEVAESILTTNDGFMFFWVDGDRYTDLVWERTNGQVTSFADLTSVDNRIKAAKYWSEGELIGPVKAEYPDDKGSYRLTLDLSDEGVLSVEEFTVLDDNGSTDLILTTTINTGNPDEDGVMVSTEKYHYDDYGLETLIYSSETEDGEEEIYGWIKGEIIYDQAYGYPLEYTVSTLEEDEWLPLVHCTFADYVNVAAGIGSAVADSTDAPVEYFDLRGVRVAAPTQPGLYIRRQGSHVDKVVVK